MTMGATPRFMFVRGLQPPHGHICQVCWLDTASYAHWYKHAGSTTPVDVADDFTAMCETCHSFALGVRRFVERHRIGRGMEVLADVLVPSEGFGEALPYLFLKASGSYFVVPKDNRLWHCSSTPPTEIVDGSFERDLGPLAFVPTDYEDTLESLWKPNLDAMSLELDQSVARGFRGLDPSKVPDEHTIDCAHTDFSRASHVPSRWAYNPGPGRHLYVAWSFMAAKFPSFILPADERREGKRQRRAVTAEGVPQVDATPAANIHRDFGPPDPKNPFLSIKL